jgi:hypothetical protein
LQPKKHLSVLFIYVRYAEKVKIEMFMICNLRCADAAPRLTTGNACPSRLFLVFISCCIHFKSFMCPMLNTLLFLYFSSLCIMHAICLIISNSFNFFREISFTFDYYMGIEQRAWDDLLDKRILMYCL